MHLWICGSFERTNGLFHQSQKCQISSLTRDLAEAVELLKEWRTLQDVPSVEAWDERVTEFLKARQE
jgi:hypothetical protein